MTGGRSVHEGMKGGEASRGRGDIRNIQALRGLAAAMVVVVHLQVIGGLLGFAPADTEMFAAGVDIFFVISGFIMVHTTRAKAVRPWQFLANRIARIVPLYWLLTLATFAVALLAPRLMGGTVGSWPALIKSLLFIPYVRPDGLVRPILFVGWSLNLEMFFYLLFSIALLSRRVRWRVAGCGVVLLALVGWHVACRAAMEPVAKFMTQPILLEFVLGMVLAAVWPRLPVRRVSPVAGSLVAGALVIAVVACARVSVGAGLPLVAIPAVALVGWALVAERGGAVVNSRVLLAVGDSSYALYLVHPFVTQAATTALRRLHAELHPGIAEATGIAAFLAALIAGYLVHRWIEKPASRLMRGSLGRAGKQGTAAPGGIEGPVAATGSAAG